MSGKFIVLEGPDGSGTTTHVALLAERLRGEGQTVFETHEPTSGPIGKSIREFLATGTLPHDALQILFTADRAWHIANEIVPALERGETIVCDRYFLSTIMYGAALGLDEEWLTEMNSVFPVPTLQLVFLPPFDVCAARLAKRGKTDVMETNSIQRRVYDHYKKYADEHHAIVIDASGEKADVANSIFSLVQAA